jgi:membrane-associated PAP2 superfamily phosphatase
LSLGLLLSVGRMLQGAHFLSHNVWTLLIDWLIAVLCYRWLLYRPGPRGDAHALTPERSPG